MRYDIYIYVIRRLNVKNNLLRKPSLLSSSAKEGPNLEGLSDRDSASESYNIVKAQYYGL